MSADPRRIEAKKELEIIHELNWRLASELFGVKGAQAGAVHPNVIATLEESVVDLVVMDPTHPERGSTWISKKVDSPRNQAIFALREVPTTLIVRGNMSQQHAVIATIARHLRTYTVDQTFSSQDIWAITVNEEVPTETITRLSAALKRKFGPSFTVETRSDLALVLCLGESVNGQTALLKEAGVHIEFMNAVAEARSTGYIVPADQATMALNTLHHAHYGEE